MNGKLIPTSDEDLGQRDQGNSLHSEVQVPVIALSSGSTRWGNHTRNISVSKSLLMPSPSVLAGNPPCCHRRTWKMSWILLSKKNMPVKLAEQWVKTPHGAGLSTGGRAHRPEGGKKKVY